MSTSNSIDALFEDFDLSRIKTEGPVEAEPITIWIPKDYKAHYDQLQERSKKRFGKQLKKVIMRSIDKVLGSEPPAA